MVAGCLARAQSPLCYKPSKAWLIKHGVTLKEQTQLQPLPEAEIGEQGVAQTVANDGR